MINVPIVQTTKMVRIPLVNGQTDIQQQADMEAVAAFKGGKVKLEKLKNKDNFESPQKRIVEVERLQTPTQGS